VLVSTPERDLVRGVQDEGPPANPHHVREWNRTEFGSMLRFMNAPIEFMGLTCNNDRDLAKRTILAVLGRDSPAVPLSPPPDFSVTAVMICYNERDILRESVEYLKEQGIGVYLIDNWSTDGSYEEAQALRAAGAGIVGLERFPADGASPTYDWARLLRRVSEVSATLPASWILHHDVDEIRESPWPGVSLRDALFRVEKEGFNAVDFSVICFHPVRDVTGPVSMRRDLSHFEFGRRPGFFKQIKGWAKDATSIPTSSCCDTTPFARSPTASGRSSWTAPRGGTARSGSGAGTSSTTAWGAATASCDRRASWCASTHSSMSDSSSSACPGSVSCDRARARESDDHGARVSDDRPPGDGPARRGTATADDELAHLREEEISGAAAVASDDLALDRALLGDTFADVVARPLLHPGLVAPRAGLAFD
jgi:hypothetical protein